MQQSHSLLDIELYNSQKLRIWDIEPINSVNISTTSQGTNLILIGHRALKKTYVMVQKGQKSQKVDIEPDNSQPTLSRALRQIRGVVQKIVLCRSRSNFQTVRGGTIVRVTPVLAHLTLKDTKMSISDTDAHK